MKLSVLILSFLTLLLYESFSQNVDIKWEKNEEYSRNYPAPEFIGEETDKIYILKGVNFNNVKDYYIEIYDRKTALSVNKIEFNVSRLPNVLNEELEKVIFDPKNSQITILTKLKENKLITLKASIMSLKGEIISEGLEIMSYTDKGSSIKGDFEIEVLENKVVIFQSLPSKRKELVQFKYTVYDLDFKKIKIKEISLPYTNNEFFMRNLFLDSKNNLYLTCRINKKKPTIEKETILFFDVNSDEMTEVNIPFPAKYITNYTLNLVNDSYFEFCGLFAENKGKSVNYPFMLPSEGLFYIKFNPQTGNVITKSICNFSIDKFSPDIFKLFKKKTGFLNSSNKLKNVYRIHEDTLIYVTEFSEDLYIYSNNSTSVTNIRMHNLIFKTDLKGNLISTSIVPKNQVLRLLENSVVFFVPISYYKRNLKIRKALSYLSFESNKQLYFMYNDNRKNMNIEKMHKPAKSFLNEETSFVVAKVDRSGKVTKKLILERTDDSFLVTPINSVVLDNGQILIFAYRRSDKDHKLGIMDFVID